MNSTSETGRAQTPPNQTSPALPSSPPVQQQAPVSDTAGMDQGPTSGPEQPASQDSQAAHAPLRRVGSDATQRPASAQQPRHDDSDEPSSADSEAEAEVEEDDSDPAHRIDHFDWDDLHHRYHEAMKTCHGEEAALTEEWESLMTVIISVYGRSQDTCMRRIERIQDCVRARHTSSTRRIRLSRRETTTSVWSRHSRMLFSFLVILRSQQSRHKACGASMQCRLLDGYYARQARPHVPHRVYTLCAAPSCDDWLLVVTSVKGPPTSKEKTMHEY
ncbi:hypothetical protein ACJQWK_05890 [Exserohilum turcicum]